MKLSRFVTGILAVALIAFMVSDVQAQRRGQGGGGRGGPGGGPGRGGPGGFGGGDPTMGLLRMEEVQEELDVTEKQKEALEKMAERSRGERPDFSGVRDMSEEDRNKLFEKMRKDAEKRTAEMKDQLIEVLLPQQISRLDEISLQVRGVQALSDPEVAGKLKITEAQKKKLKEVSDGLRESMRERMREVFTGGGGAEAFGKIREEMEKEVLAVLDTSQQKEFEEMKGEKFDMPQGGRGFGGGGRGGRGGDARGGRGGGGPGGPGGGGGRRGRPETE